MNALRCALFGALAVIGIGVADPSARAQVGPNPSVTVTGPPTADIGSVYEMTVSLYLPQGYYTNLDVQFDFPSLTTHPYQMFQADGIPADFTRGAVAGQTRHYNATLVDLRTAAAFRTFKIYGYANPFSTVPGTPLPYHVTVTGNVGEGQTPDSLPEVTGTTTVTAIGEPSVIFQPNVGGGQAYVHNGVPGVIITYYGQIGSANKIPTALPHTFTYELGSGLTYIRKLAIAGDAIEEDEGTPGQIGGVVTQTSPYSENLWTGIDVFVPCSGLALNAETPENYRVTLSYDTAELNWVGDLEGGPQTGDAIHFEADLDPSQWWYSAAAECGAGGDVTKIPYVLSGFGNRPLWRLYVTPPFGVAHVDDAMVVDVLPSDMATDGIWMTPPEGWTAYSCNFDGVFPGGDYFAVGEFLPAIADHCRVYSPTTSWVTAGDTHLVLYRETWDPPLSFQLDYYTARTVKNDTATNIAYLNGSWADETETHAIGDQIAEVDIEDGYESKATMSTTPSPTKTYAYFGGQDFYLDANNGYASVLPYAAYDESTRIPVNPTLALDVPPGVIVDSFSYYLNYSCADYQSWDTPNVTDRPMVWSIGTAQNPYESPCAVANYVNFHLDANYPFVHGEIIPFTFTALPDTDTATDWNIAHRNVIAIVAEGMDVKLTASCYPQSPGNGLYKVTAINRGQQSLSAITLTFEVPANATFVGAQIGSAPDVPAGAFLQYSTDGGATWGTTPSSGVTHVRLTNFAIPGLGVDAIRPYFHVLVHPNTTNNVTAKAVMESAELGATPEKATSFAVSECRYGGNVHVQFTGGAALSGWSVTVSNGNGVVASGVTDDAGDFTPSLGLGTYTVTIAPPGAIPNLTWNGTLTQTLTVSGQPPTVTFTVDCSCNDSDPCTIDSCLSPGECDHAFDEECGSCTEADPTCAAGGWAFYVAVEGPNGQSGVVRCTIGADTSSITCDTTNILDAACE